MSDPATLGLVISVLASVASQLLASKGPGISQTGPRVGDTGVSSSAYGEAIPINYGTVRTGGNVIWSPGRREVRRVVDSQQGKGGGPTVTSTTFAYYLDAAIAIGEGPVEAVTRVWANSKLIYDARPGSKTYFKYPTAHVRFYPGDEEQLPDSLIESIEGAGNAPAYRGLAYVVLQDFPLRDFGNGVPQFTFEATWSVTDSYPSEVLWDGAEGYVNPTWQRYNAIALDAENGVLWASASDVGPPSAPYVWSRIDLKAGHIVSQRQMVAGGSDSDLDEKITPVNDADAVVAGPWLLFTGKGSTSGQRLWKLEKRSFRVVAKSSALSSNREMTSILAFDSISPLELEPEVACLALCEFTRELSMFTSDISDGEVLTFLSASTVDALPSSAVFSAIAGPDYHGYCWVAWKSPSSIGLAKVRVFLPDSVTTGSSSLGGGVGVRYFDVPIIEDVFDLTVDVFGYSALVPLVYGLYLDVDAQHLVFFADATVAGKLRIARWDIASESLVDSIALEALGWTGHPLANSLRRTVRWAREQSTVSHLYVVRDGADSVYRFEWRAPDGVGGTGFKMEALDLVTDFSLPGSLDSNIGCLHLADHNDLVVRVKVGGPARSVYRLGLDRLETSAADLEDVVVDLCARAGLDADDVDASQLAGIDVQGVEVTQRGALRDVLDRLSIAYLFDAVESDGGLKFVLRGGASSETIDGDDLGAALDKLPDQPTRLKERTTQEEEVPFQVDLKYSDVDRDYQAGNAIAKRIKSPSPTVESGEPQRLELPVVFTADEATRAADAQLGATWAAREKQSGALPPRFLALDPADVVTIARDGEADLLVRVDELSFGGGMLIEFESSGEDPSVYSSDRSGTSGDGFAESGFEVSGAIQLRVLDLPLLKDSHSRAYLTGPYFGAELEAGDFRGASVHQSLDQLSWLQVAVLPEHVLGGVALVGADALPEELWYQTDRDLSLTIVPFGDDSADALESITDAQLLSDRNVAAWGNAVDGWEVVKFRDATDEGDGTWTLGGAWVRGRRGTARVAAVGHSAGDYFLLLNPNQSTGSWYRNTYDAAVLGQVRFFRATPLGNPFEAVDFSSVTITGTDLKPYEVVHVSSERGVPSTNDVRLSWTRQTRVGGQAEWGDGVADTPLSEESEQYEVVLLGGSGYSDPGDEALSKTFTDQTDTSGDDFTAAEQATAGYAVSDDLDFVIYQLSATVGRGFPRSVTVPGV